MKNWTSDELVRFSGSYWGVCALHAAVALDVFSPLNAGPLSSAVLAERLHASPRGMEMLLTALCALDLLQRNQDSFSLTPFARAFLCRNSPDYMGYIIDHHRQLMPGWSRLAEAVREGRSTRARASFSAEERESFLLGMYNNAELNAARVMKTVKLDGCSRLLDLGGGSGAYAVQFCLNNPKLEAIIFDLPTSQPFAEKILTRYKMKERIHFQGGDFLKDELPSEFDAVWLSHILHGNGDEQARTVVNKAAKTLRPGGRMFIQEFILDNDRKGPLFPALFALNMLTGSNEGKAFTESELTTLMRDAGGKDVHRLPQEADSGIVTAVF